MGSRPLELILGRRLVAVLGAALVLAGGATVLVVALVLRGVDEDAARARAAGSVKMMRAEIAERVGAPEEKAVDEAFAEVVRLTEDDGARLIVRRRGRGRGQGEDGESRGVLSATGAPFPAELRELRVGACGTARDADGLPWSACAVAEADGPLEVVAAVPTVAHAAALRAITLGTGVAVVLALLAAVGALRTALRAPIHALRALVAWTDGVSGNERPATAATSPSPSADASAEIELLAAAFDGLVERLFEALERERATSAHIAHELRTPVTALRLELERLDAVDPRIDRMRADVDQLARAIDGVLALAGPRNADVGNTVVNLADLARELTPPTARLDAPDEALIEGDPQLLELALKNVLDNAQKHGGGATAVVVRRNGERVEIAVRDHGVGLPPEARARMFDRYWRHERAGVGRGLGLALVRSVAERHGGFAFGHENPEGDGAEIGLCVGRVVAWHEEPPAGPFRA